MLQDLKSTGKGEQAHDGRGEGHKKVDVGVISRRPIGVASKQSYARNLGICLSLSVVSLCSGNNSMSNLIDCIAHSPHLP